MTNSKSLIGKKLLIVGNPEQTHVGAHLRNAARDLELKVKLSDTRKAGSSSILLTKFNWWMRGHRPPNLRKFSRQVVQLCREFSPSWILSTGLAPIEAWALKEIAELRVSRLNFLTDDPWNPVHRAPWFMKSLSLYDHVFSPRRANLDDLRGLGISQVSYLPFAYAPEIHFREPFATGEEEMPRSSDVVFAGGADSDRVPIFAELIHAGFNVALYGSYWDRFKETREHARGNADPQMLRKAVAGAKVAVCLVRRANRDGHAMRTFEVPALGACMLVEDTEEHREIFGEENSTVLYFRQLDELFEKLRWLLVHSEERNRLAISAHTLIVTGCNTYRDRLVSMLLATPLPDQS